jgi:hypothetical protein
MQVFVCALSVVVSSGARVRKKRLEFCECDWKEKGVLLWMWNTFTGVVYIWVAIPVQISKGCKSFCPKFIP